MSQALPPIRVAVTGGAGQIAYSLLFRIASGEVFGPDRKVELHILEVKEALEALKGVEMELEDCAYPTLVNLQYGSDPEELFKGIDWAILVGAKPRGPGMERKDLLGENARIFIEQGKALNASAKKSAQVFVVGNPCNTNAWVTLKNAPQLDPKNFHAMMRLDQSRGVNRLAKEAGVSLDKVKKMVIWGNHSATQVPDFHNVLIDGKRGTASLNRDFLEKEFFAFLQQRGASVIKARGKSSAGSAAAAIVASIQSIQGTDECYSDAIYSKGNPYGIDPDLVFSFPCRSHKGEVQILPNWPLDPFIEKKIKETERELQEERELVSKLF